MVLSSCDQFKFTKAFEKLSEENYTMQGAMRMDMKMTYMGQNVEQTMVADLLIQSSPTEVYSETKMNGAIQKSYVKIDKENSTVTMYTNEGLSCKKENKSLEEYKNESDSYFLDIETKDVFTLKDDVWVGNTEIITSMLEKSAKQVMETMCCHVNNLHADEMFIQYQGDLFSDVEIGGASTVHIPLQLDSLPFHLMIHEGKECFTYELRYWKNRFNEASLRIFMDTLEAVICGILKTDNVNNLRSYLPKELLAENKEINGDSATIVNRYGDTQPIGGWGKLLLNQKETGRTARITAENTIDYLEDSGRTIMQESLTGRNYIDLHKVEQDIASLLPETGQCEAYITYGKNNKLVLTARITAEKELDNIEEVKEILSKYCIKSQQPYEVVFSKN